MAIGATIGAAAIGGGLSYLGAREQSKAIEQAGQTQAQSQQAALDFQRQIYEEGEPYREATREDLLADPGTSPLFQSGLSSGIENIQTQLAKYGLTDSSTSGRAVGEFTAGLTAQDIENVRARRMGLAGLVGTGQAGALQAAGLAQQAGAGLAGTQISGGAVRGGLYGSLGQTVAGLPLQYAQYQGLQNLAPWGPATTMYGPTTSSSPITHNRR